MTGSAAGMHLAIVDHSLRDGGGHHYEYDSAIAAAAAERGMTVTVLANSTYDAPEQSMALAGTVLPWFRQSFYEMAEGGALRRLVYPLLSALPPALARSVHLALRRIWDQRRRNPLRAAANGFGVDMMAAIDTRRLGAGDHVLVHTLNLDDLQSVAAALIDPSLDPARLPAIHLVLRRTVAEMAAGRPQGQRPGDVLNRLAAAGLGAWPIRIWSDTTELAADYADLSPLPVGVLPIAFRQDMLLAALADHAARTLAAESGADRPVTIGYLGNARLEKGFQYLPAMVDAVLAHPRHGRRVRFVVQCGLNIEGGEPGILAARRHLAGLPDHRVQLVDGVPDAAAYYRLLADLDIVLLPYEAASYRTRSSGILAQALAAGCPVLVPAGTWMAGQIDQYRGRCFDDSRQLSGILIEMLDDLPSLSAQAADAAPAWRRRHAPAQFIDLLVNSVEAEARTDPGCRD
ncbi:MAG TPA: glycosyltransferase [Stellaceae bacterium]|nr:glycosyltransferase [Stellaceae bacterium]